MFTKYADAEIVEFVPLTTEEIKKTASFEHIPEDSFRTNDGYMYVKVRAISSRVNKNNDGWPVEELAGMHEPDYRSLVSKLEAEGKTSAEEKRVFTSSNLSTKGEYGFKTFAGRPVFVDHNNTNPHRARGVIVDSLLYIEPSSKKYASDDYWTKAPGNHTPETWIELLLEVDAKSFPKLAKEIKEGKINAVSMGANVDYTKCSVCDNKAVSIGDYCNHIKNKGIKHIAADGTVKHSYEDCYGVNFFEISFVFDPADVTALTTGPVIAKVAGEYTGEMVHWKVIMKDHSMLNFQAPDDRRLIYKMLADVYDYMPEDVAHMEHDNEPDEFTKVPEYIQNHERQIAEGVQPTVQDHDFLNDMGIKWANNFGVFIIKNPWTNKKVINPSTQEVLYFNTEEEAEKYKTQIEPEFPSKDLPLVVERAENPNLDSQVEEEKKPSFEDHDFLNDHGIKWASPISSYQNWLDIAVEGYLEAALWAGLDYDQEDESGNNPPLDEKYDTSDVSGETRQRILSEVDQLAKSVDDFSWGEMDPEQFGHDFYLTRNHHGAGFWDRGLGELGDKLTQAAHSFGEDNLMSEDFTNLSYDDVTPQPDEVLQTQVEQSPSFEDHDFLNDHGIKWAKPEGPKWDDDPNEPFWKEKKEAEPSEEDEDFLKKFDIKWAKVADTIAPSKIDTLRKDAQCPFDIKQCGMDESGQCNVCGYEKPPEGFDDPDISEAKRVQEKVDRIRNEDGLDQPGVAIKIDDNAPKELTNVDRLRKMKKILTKAQLRQINDQTKTK